MHDIINVSGFTKFFRLTGGILYSTFHLCLYVLIFMPYILGTLFVLTSLFLGMLYFMPAGAGRQADDPPFEDL